MKSAKAKQTWPMGHKVNSMKSSGAGREGKREGNYKSNKLAHMF